MSTTKQKLALQKTVVYGGNVTRAMREAGYAEATANNPSNLTKSKGFLELCEKQGLTDNLLVNALVEDIQAKPGDRKAELELGFKIRGRLVQKSDATFVPHEPTAEQKKRISDLIDEVLATS